MDNINDGINLGKIIHNKPIRSKDNNQNNEEKIYTEQSKFIKDLNGDPVGFNNRLLIKYNAKANNNKQQDDAAKISRIIDPENLDPELKARIAADLAFLKKKPVLVKRSNDMYETAYQKSLDNNDADSCQKACNAQHAFIKEFDKED